MSNDLLIDKRIIERNIKKGRLDAAEHRKMLDALPDLRSNLWRRPEPQVHVEKVHVETHAPVHAPAPMAAPVYAPAPVAAPAAPAPMVAAYPPAPMAAAPAAPAEFGQSADEPEEEDDEPEDDDDEDDTIAEPSSPLG